MISLIGGVLSTEKKVDANISGVGDVVFILAALKKHFPTADWKIVISVQTSTKLRSLCKANPDKILLSNRPDAHRICFLDFQPPGLPTKGAHIDSDTLNKLSTEYKLSVDQYKQFVAGCDGFTIEMSLCSESLFGEAKNSFVKSESKDSSVQPVTYCYEFFEADNFRGVLSTVKDLKYFGVEVSAVWKGLLGCQRGTAYGGVHVIQDKAGKNLLCAGYELVKKHVFLPMICHSTSASWFGVVKHHNLIRMCSWTGRPIVMSPINNVMVPTRAVATTSRNLFSGEDFDDMLLEVDIADIARTDYVSMFTPAAPAQPDIVPVASNITTTVLSPNPATTTTTNVIMPVSSNSANTAPPVHPSAVVVPPVVAAPNPRDTYAAVNVSDVEFSF